MTFDSPSNIQPIRFRPKNEMIILKGEEREEGGEIKIERVGTADALTIRTEREKQKETESTHTK